MSEIGFTTKQPKIIREDRSWYKSYCTQCPYFVNDEILQMLHCIRPVGEECLAEGILVELVIMTDIHNARAKEQLAMKEQYEIKPIKHKKIKRRR